MQLKVLQLGMPLSHTKSIRLGCKFVSAANSPSFYKKLNVINNEEGTLTEEEASVNLTS
jgi:hypothetical protein